MTPAIQLAPKMYFKVDGSEATEQMADCLISIEVDDSLFLPDMFVIHLRDTTIQWTDSDTFDLGKTIEVSANNGAGEARIAIGDITSIETLFNPVTGPTLILRGYDRSHRLNRNKQSRSFVQMTDSDIVDKIAKEAGLRTQIQSTPQVHDYVLQKNQTDWEFLTQRARCIGYRLFIEEDTLHYERAASQNGSTPTVEWAVDLIEFNARMSTALQVSEVIVQGWDPSTQQQVVGRATTVEDTPQIGETRQGGQAAQQAFGVTAKKIIVNRPVASQSEADRVAQAVLNEIGQGFIEAQCICFGNPAIQAGALVRIEGVGTRFSGTYRVTHAIHRYDTSGYKTEFTIGGAHASTLTDLLMPVGGNYTSSHGPMLGVVTNNDDPEKLGRVKVKFPTLTTSHESNWARLATPGGGKERGLVWVPDVDDEVFVVFEHEDINRPIVVGGLWSQKAAPADSSNLVASGKAASVRIDTHEKIGLIISDKPDDASLKLGDQENQLAISKTNRQANLKSGDQLSLEGMNVSINAQTNLEIKSTGNIKIEGSGVVEIKGAVIKLN